MRLSVDRPVDRPLSSIDWAGRPGQPRLAHVSRSTAPVDCSFATVDRAVDRAMPCTSCTPVDWVVDRFCPGLLHTCVLAPFGFRSLHYLSQ